MKFIQRYDLNTSKWDELVQKNQGFCYHYSWYLDATAKNWGVYTNDDYSSGVAIAYNEVLGQKILYPALFGRTLSFFGMKQKQIETLIVQLKGDFPIGQIQLDLEMDEKASEVKTYQNLKAANFNKLTKRMLQKADRNQIEIQNIHWTKSVHLVEQELGPKVSMMRGENLMRLNNLLTELEERKAFTSIGIMKDGNCLGCLYMVRDGNRILYLKGAATKEIKEMGGVYLAMKQQIEYACQQDLILDFGGSSIPGIKRFFNGFGGEDQNYWVYQWDNAPIWFKTLRKIKKILK